MSAPEPVVSVRVTPAELAQLRRALHEVRALETGDFDQIGADYGMRWMNAAAALANDVEELLEAVRQRTRPLLAEVDPRPGDVAMHLGGAR